MFSVPVPRHGCIRDHGAQVTGNHCAEGSSEHNREFSTGLQYIAISRVKTLNNGILFEEPFDYEQVPSRHTPPIVQMRNEDYDHRRGQHMEQPLCA